MSIIYIYIVCVCHFSNRFKEFIPWCLGRHNPGSVMTNVYIYICLYIYDTHTRYFLIWLTFKMTSLDFKLPATPEESKQTGETAVSFWRTLEGNWPSWQRTCETHLGLTQELIDC